MLTMRMHLRDGWEKHPEDVRVLQITKPEDLSVFRQRKEHKINGIVLPFNFSSEIEAGIRTSIPKILRSKSSPRSQTTDYELTQTQIFFDWFNPYDDDRIHPEFVEGFTQLADHFEHATGERNERTESFWINPTHHPKYLKHQTAGAVMIYTMDGYGTWCKNENGEEYDVGAGNIFIFDGEAIEHRAPPLIPGEDRLMFAYS